VLQELVIGEPGHHIIGSSDRFEPNQVQIKQIRLLKMPKSTTRKASANTMQSEVEDTQTEKNLYEIIVALRSEITHLKDEVQELQKDKPAQCGSSLLATPPLKRETPIEPAQSHKWWIRDIVAPVPEFNGHNSDISHFIAACRNVQELITTLLLSKLKGDANGRYKYGITTITGLIDVLKSKFENRQTLSDCYQD